MRIAYQRMSGAVGLSLEEKGTRGLWWEKRRALFSALQNRGHQICLTSRVTKQTKASGYSFLPFREPAWYDMLMIEFGSSNSQFYGKDLEETRNAAAMMCAAGKPVIFLCDDPDLPYLWKTMTGQHKNWSVWMNARYPQPFGGQPETVRSFDFPFSSLQNCSNPSSHFQKDALVYIGRPNGRESSVKDLIQSRAPWRVYGRPAEWAKFGVPVFEAPNQPQRSAFYQGQIGSLVLADSKHKRLGWRTGRAYHALLAGCPAVVEASHTALSHFQTFREGAEIRHILNLWSDPKVRMQEWERQINILNDEKQIAETTFKAHGL